LAGDQISCLHRVTRGSTFIWSDEAQLAFEDVQFLLTKSKLLFVFRGEAFQALIPALKELIGLCTALKAVQSQFEYGHFPLKVFVDSLPIVLCQPCVMKFYVTL
jgi:hypothetical protein